MALGFVLDEHLRGPLWRAIQRHNARGQNPIDAVRVGDPPDLPLSSSDPAVLLWAEREDRILISHDKRSLPVHLDRHLRDGHHCPGIFTIRRGSALGGLVSFLVLTAYASDASEWRDRIEYIG